MFHRIKRMPQSGHPYAKLQKINALVRRAAADMYATASSAGMVLDNVYVTAADAAAALAR